MPNVSFSFFLSFRKSSLITHVSHFPDFRVFSGHCGILFACCSICFCYIPPKKALVWYRCCFFCLCYSSKHSVFFFTYGRINTELTNCVPFVYKSGVLKLQLLLWVHHTTWPDVHSSHLCMMYEQPFATLSFPKHSCQPSAFSEVLWLFFVVWKHESTYKHAANTHCANKVL